MRKETAVKKWLYGVPLALCAVLLAAVLWQNQKLDALNAETLPAGS